MSSRTIRLTLVGLPLLALTTYFALQRKGRDSSLAATTLAKLTGRARVPVGSGLNGSGGDVELPAIIDRAPAGELRLEGQVVDESQSPLGNVAVTVSSQPARAVKTEADGTFAFDRLARGTYRVVAHRGMMCGGPVTVRLTKTSQPVILVVRQGATLDVQVSAAADRKSIADASVELRGEGTRLILSGLTGADGKLALAGVPRGRYTLAAGASGSATAYQTVEVPEGAEHVQVHVALEVGLPASGMVLSPEGRPAAGARVLFERPSDSPWAQPDIDRDSATTDGNGRFRFAALAAGSYRFIARHDDFAPGASGLEIVDNRRSVDGIVIRLQEGAVIAGTVVEGDGNAPPSAGATVRVVPAQSRGAMARIREAGTDSHGRFRIGGLPRRPVQLLAVSDNGSSPVLALDLASQPTPTDVVLKLSGLGTISGVVVNATGQPVEGAQVSARQNLANADPVAVRLRGALGDVTDGRGSFTLVGLEPSGSYSLLAHAAATAAERYLSSPVWVTAKVGERSVKLVLQSSGAILGHVLYADGSAPPLFLIRVGTEIPSAFSNSDGHFELRGVPTGRVTMTVSGPSFEGKVVPDVLVEDGGQANTGTITVKKGRSIFGRVLSDDGTPVAGASVFTGKRIVGSGASLSTQTWGTPGSAGATKMEESDERGMFVLNGVGTMDIVVVADHATRGRSAIVRIPGSDQSVNVDLVLLPFGALEGKITRGGQPVAGRTIMASGQAIIHNSNFVVTSGSDGIFRFDRLTPDNYFVSLLNGLNPIFGVSSNGIMVAVTAGQVASAVLEIPDETVTLYIEPTLASGTLATLAEVHVVAGTVSARVAHEIHDFEAAMKGGFFSFNIIVNGKAAKVRNVPAKQAYSACAVVYPSELAGRPPAVAGEYVDREGKNLPAFCVPIAVSAEPEQTFSIAVTEPETPAVAIN